uniref:Microtubule associated protein 2 n=1 Tax=Macaca fascicularis TaxID=9541 RepID=A0A7N9CLB0_MACFA
MQPTSAGSTDRLPYSKSGNKDGVTKSPEKRSSLPRPSSILPPRRGVSGDRDENSFSLNSSLSSSARRTTKQEKVVPQHPLPLGLLPSLLAPHQVILHARQALLEPLAIPGPLTHQERPSLPSWCRVRRRSPSYVLLQNLLRLPNSFGL